MAKNNNVGIDRNNRINRDERREYNKIRARKMVLVLGIASIIFILAMMVEVYL